MRPRQLVSRLCLSLAFAIALGSSVSAAPLAYDEVLDGELPHPFQGPGPVPVLRLGLGTNVIQGQLSTPYSGIELLDAFTLEIPEGTELVSGTLSYGFSGNMFYQVEWWADGARQFIDAPWSGRTADPLGSLGPGRYTWYTDMVAAASGGIPSTYSYQFSLDLVAVPLPAAVWLFGGAISVLGVLCRSAERAQ